MKDPVSNYCEWLDKKAGDNMTVLMLLILGTACIPLCAIVLAFALSVVWITA